MTSTETTNEVVKNPCEREVTVEIPAEQISREWESAVNKIQKFARIPGFRKGKVPATIVRKRFDEEIKTEIIEHLVPPAFRTETQKQNLVPIGQPQVVELELEEGKPMKFKAVFEVLPSFDVNGYKDIKVAREDVSVSDEDVQKAIDSLREQNATYENVEEDRGLADGDFGSVSLKSTSDEPNAEPIEMNDVLVDIGGTNTLKEFSENLRGAKAGETRTFDVTYPEDFGDKRLAGKTLHYSVEVKGIKRKATPELNDEWVKDLGQEDLKTVDDLRKRIREGMEHEKQHQAEHKVKDEILKQLTDRFAIDVPNVLVENAIDQRLERGLRALAQQGLRPEDMKRMDLSRLRDGQREGAVRDVRSQLLLEKIAEAENIEISDEDLDKEIAGMAGQMRQTPQALRKQLEDNGGIDRLRSQMRSDRALDVLYKQA